MCVCVFSHQLFLSHLLHMLPFVGVNICFLINVIYSIRGSLASRLQLHHLNLNLNLNLQVVMMTPKDQSQGLEERGKKKGTS